MAAAIFLVFAPVSCTKKREPGPLLLWLDLTENEVEVFRDVLAEFESFTGIQTRIKVVSREVILMDFDSSGLAKLEVPDLVDVDIYHLEDARSRVKDLTEEALDNFDVGWLYLSGLNPAMSGNRLHFLPYRLYWPVMVYNCFEIEKPPETWEGLLEVAESEPGKLGLQGLYSENLVLEIVSWIWQAEGDPYYLIHPNTREAFYFLRKLGSVANISSRAFRGESLISAQDAGDVAIHFNGTDEIRMMAQRGMTAFSHCTAPMPEGPRNPRVAVAARYLAVPLTSRHPDEAVKCIRFLSTIKVQSHLADRLCWPPVRSDAWAWKDEAKGRAMRGFMMSGMSGVGIEARGDFDEISKLWVGAFEEIVFDQSPVEETLRKYNEKMERLLK